MSKVETAYEQCEKVISYHSKTFYKAFSLLPKKDRQAVWAVYTFCRTVDDIVDEGSNPTVELAQFSKEFHQFLHGTYDDRQFMWTALADVFQRYEMDEKPFLQLIEGQEMDLYKNRYDTIDELLRYCYLVASTVGLMLLPILAPKKVDILKNGAVSLGLAMQLTNILRDIGEDLDRNRIYVSNDVMTMYGNSEASLFAGEVNASFISMWEHFAEKAEVYYQEALSTIHHYPVHSRIPVKSAAILYREILPTIRVKNYQVFQEKHFVTSEAKQLILAQI